ncbi:MAG TPA: hypothetical protein VGO55_01985 [Allosphingosinicella sp.]|jgi:hypothetical protein|nr:hypothetical protein [Allosphingosinicella sp.]
MLAATALAIATAPAPALPGRGAVWSALDRDLNTRCGGGVESADCVSHPASVSVRGLRCGAEPDGRALCRYERRIATIGGRRARWEAAETRFRHHRGTMVWSIERDFPLTPERADVEGALHVRAGALCLILIDDCVDGQGNETIPVPEFTVSALECRPAADRRAVCSFTSTRHFGPDNAGPSERCTGTLQRGDQDGGESSWTFVVPNRRRRPFDALLSCS